MALSEYVARRGRVAAIALVGFAAVPWSRIHPQSDPAPSGLEAARVRFAAAIRAAEADGARAPRDSTTPGVADRRCVDATGELQATSGQFGAGSFRFYATVWHQGYGKLWWRPARPSPADTLVLRATHLSDSVFAREYRKAVLARPVPDNGDRFYMITDRLPTDGAWLLVARAGTNWGCFFLQL